jgi:4-diphosphocytidyl-2C-methyl-D-erythritol kinase
MATKEELDAVATRIAADVSSAVDEIKALIAGGTGSINPADLDPILAKLSAAADALEAAPKAP